MALFYQTAASATRCLLGLDIRKPYFTGRKRARYHACYMPNDVMLQVRQTCMFLASAQVLW